MYCRYCHGDEDIDTKIKNLRPMRLDAFCHRYFSHRIAIFLQILVLIIIFLVSFILPFLALMYLPILTIPNRFLAELCSLGIVLVFTLSMLCKGVERTFEPYLKFMIGSPIIKWMIEKVNEEVHPSQINFYMDLSRIE